MHACNAFHLNVNEMAKSLDSVEKIRFVPSFEMLIISSAINIVNRRKKKGRETISSTFIFKTIQKPSNYWYFPVAISLALRMILPSRCYFYFFFSTFCVFILQTWPIVIQCTTAVPCNLSSNLKLFYIACKAFWFSNWCLLTVK